MSIFASGVDWKHLTLPPLLSFSFSSSISVSQISHSSLFLSRLSVILSNFPKMNYYFSSPYPFIIFFSFFGPFFQLSYGDNYPNYTACSQKFECGNIMNVSYPFWGKDRPEYCGHPGFQLNCQGDIVDMRIGSQIYHVLNITDGVHTLQIAPINDACPLPPRNISLPSDLFNYSLPINRNLVLAYGCQPYPDVTTAHPVYCPANKIVAGNYFSVASSTPDYSRCEFIVVVPILEKLVQNLTTMRLTVEDVLKQGFEVRYDGNASFCDRCENSSGQCGYNFSTIQPTCFCYDGEYPETCPTRPPSTSVIRRRSTKLKIGIGLGAAFGMLILACIAFIIYHRYQKKKSDSSSNLISRSLSRDDSVKPDPENGSIYFKTPIFSYKELDEATNHFDEKKELGDGGFGTVYHGKLRDGRVVAVKRLFENNYKRVEQFMNEIEILSLLRHQNLVSLYGCTSRHSRELLLVYEYVPNGTIADHIHGNRAKENLLTWPIRMSIAIESADALAYLHASEIIHRDVKSNNILLDNNFHVKVADFGLSRLFPTDVTHVSTAPQGTPGYVDPEYYQCYQLNDKSDVYSFGVVLIELISSKTAVDISRHRHEINLANMAINRIQQRALHELVDPNLGYETDYEIRNMMTLVAELAFRCLQQEKDMRPCMMEVLEILQGIASDTKNNTDDMDTSAASRLLKHSQPLSPDAVTDEWPSRTTTPNTSG